MTLGGCLRGHAPKPSRGQPNIAGVFPSNIRENNQIKTAIYALGGGDLLLLRNDYQELAQRSITPEQEIVTRPFCYFGLPTEGLFKQIDNEDWRDALKGAAEVAERTLKEQPELIFQNWGEDLGPG